MRFILNFIFYGFLFYIIWLFFPDAFNKLVSWVTQAYEFLRDLVMQVIAKFNHSTESGSHTAMVFFRLFNNSD